MVDLPILLKENIVTLEKTSCDTSNKECLTHSQKKVINYDGVIKSFCKENDYEGSFYSNDALCFTSIKNEIIFIEFKNIGKVFEVKTGRKNRKKKANIQLKLHAKLSNSIFSLMKILDCDCNYLKKI